jgi:hypothetical protein
LGGDFAPDRDRGKKEKPLKINDFQRFFIGLIDPLVTPVVSGIFHLLALAIKELRARVRADSLLAHSATSMFFTVMMIR